MLEELSRLADPVLLEYAAVLVRATRDHTIPSGLQPGLAQGRHRVPGSRDAVLGADLATYEEYERGIAAEYVPVFGRQEFERGRRQFLQATLTRPRLFHTDNAHVALDAAARSNIRRATDALS